MKLVRMVAACLMLALPLNGCAVAAPVVARMAVAAVGNVQVDRIVPANVQATADTVVLNGTKAFLFAEYAYNTVGTAALALLRSGAIRGANAATVRRLNATATAALERGYRAQTAAVRAVEARTLFDVVDALCGLGVANRICAALPGRP